MIFSVAVVISLPLLCARFTAGNKILDARASCKQDYVSCSPKGASTQDEPPIGSALSLFLVDIVNTVDSNNKEKRHPKTDGSVLQLRTSGGSLCCAEGTQCLLLRDSNLPFCYDNYTTNYFLPGGSYGQIVSGNYNSPDGSSANLISGNYTTADGKSGNVYGSPSSPSKPDTATLVIPTQYTASGSGSAIPVTALGQEVTHTTTIPGTTIPPSIVPETTMNPIVSGNSTLSFASTPGLSRTIQGTTIAPQTSTFTTKITEASSTKQSSAKGLEPGVRFLLITVLFKFLVHV